MAAGNSRSIFQKVDQIPTIIIFFSKVSNPSKIKNYSNLEPESTSSKFNLNFITIFKKIEILHPKTLCCLWLCNHFNKKIN
jgi:hypothetical protein